MSAAGALAATLLAPTAGAAPSRAIHVVAEPSAPCLVQAGFERALFAKITRPRGSGRSDETKVIVRVEAEGDRFTGRVTIAEPSQPARERTVRGPSCVDVASSLVLFAALALGGELDPEPARPAVREPADDARDDPPPPPAVAPPPPRWATRVGVHAGLATAGADQASGGGDLFGELAALRAGLAPGLRIALGYATAAHARGPVGMRVSTATTRLEPSLIRFAAGPAIARLVLALELGVATASASGAARSEAVARPWLRAGAQAEAALEVVGPVAVELTVGALVAVVRDDFVIEPSGFGLRVPLVAPLARVGFIVRLQ